MNKNTRLIFMLPLCLSLLFASCASSKKRDVFLSSDNNLAFEDIADISRAVAEYDAWALQNGEASALAQGSEVAQYSTILSDISVAKKAAGVQKALLARLESLEGISALINGNIAKANECYNRARQQYKGDAMCIILGSRLGLNISLEDAMEQMENSNEKALLTLEKAIQKYKAEDYLSSLAQFDAAFIALESFYAESYRPLRDKAWNFRSISNTETPSSVRELLKKASLSAEELAFLTEEETDLLMQYTQGTHYSQKRIFDIVAKAGLFTPLSSSRSTTVSRSDRVTRLICARYLWNLFILGKTTYTSYSTLYQQGAQSPVQDIPLESEDFDAVLGCVENEIMDLPDGIHFFPDNEPSAVEVHSWLRAVQAQ